MIPVAPAESVSAYARAVVAGEVDACRFVRLACQRFLDDLEKSKSPDFPYEFRPELAERFFKFSRLLHHYKGSFRGKPLELLPWQRFVLGNVYGWVEKGTSVWRFRDVYLEVPRKNGKSFLAAAVALYDVSFVESTGAEVYIASTKLDQSKIVFKDAVAVLKGSKPLRPHFEILNGTNLILPKEGQRTSFIKPLGGDSERLDGLNPLTVIFDEVHAFNDRALWDVLQGGFGGRKNYHTVAITTAGTNREGVCFEQREQLIKILEGHFQNDRKFGVIYTLDTGEEDDWESEKNWFKANPSLGAGKELDGFRSMVENAKQVPGLLHDLLTKQFNIWLNASSSWLSPDDWVKNEADMPDLKGKRCIVGLDLAQTNDLSAATLYFPPQEGLLHGFAYCRAYLPAETIAEAQHKTGAPLMNWAKQGFLTLTPGTTTDFSVILKDSLQNS